VQATFAATPDDELQVDPFDAISMISLMATVLNICYNMWLMISTFAVNEYKKKQEASKAAENMVVNVLFRT
jgi:hypothetical protein